MCHSLTTVIARVASDVDRDPTPPLRLIEHPAQQHVTAPQRRRLEAFELGLEQPRLDRVRDRAPADRHPTT